MFLTDDAISQLLGPAAIVSGFRTSASPDASGNGIGFWFSVTADADAGGTPGNDAVPGYFSSASAPDGTSATANVQTDGVNVQGSTAMSGSGGASARASAVGIGTAGSFSLGGVIPVGTASNSSATGGMDYAPVVGPSYAHFNIQSQGNGATTGAGEFAWYGPILGGGPLEVQGSLYSRSSGSQADSASADLRGAPSAPSTIDLNSTTYDGGYGYTHAQYGFLTGTITAGTNPLAAAGGTGGLTVLGKSTLQAVGPRYAVGQNSLEVPDASSLFGATGAAAGGTGNGVSNSTIGLSNATARDNAFASINGMARNDAIATGYDVYGSVTDFDSATGTMTSDNNNLLAGPAASCSSIFNLGITGTSPSTDASQQHSEGRMSASAIATAGTVSNQGSLSSARGGNGAITFSGSAPVVTAIPSYVNVSGSLSTSTAPVQNTSATTTLNLNGASSSRTATIASQSAAGGPSAGSTALNANNSATITVGGAAVAAISTDGTVPAGSSGTSSSTNSVTAETARAAASAQSDISGSTVNASFGGTAMDSTAGMGPVAAVGDLTLGLSAAPGSYVDVTLTIGPDANRDGYADSTAFSGHYRWDVTSTGNSITRSGWSAADFPDPSNGVASLATRNYSIPAGPTDALVIKFIYTSQVFGTTSIGSGTLNYVA